MLTVAGLSKSFGGRNLYGDVSLTIQTGESSFNRIAFPQLKLKCGGI